MMLKCSGPRPDHCGTTSEICLSAFHEGFPRGFFLGIFSIGIFHGGFTIGSFLFSGGFPLDELPYSGALITQFVSLHFKYG